MTGRNVRLDRALYLDVLRCPRLLWLRARRPDLVPDDGPDEAARFRAEDAREVRALARGLWPGGATVPGGADNPDAVVATRRFMADRAMRAIFGAAFSYDGVDLRTDVLVRADGAGGAWDLFSVRATTEVKEEHVLDLGLQSHVLRGSGVPVGRAMVVHLDRGYVRGDDGLDLHSLFVRADLTRAVEEKTALVPGHLDALRDVLAVPEPPPAAPGRRCREPHDCPFAAHCAPPPGRYDVARLPRSARLAAEMAAVGVTDVRDIPPGTRLTPTQARVVGSLVEGREHVGQGLRAALEAVEHSVMFLDFETTAFAGPRYPGTSPYQPLPTQWSLHRLGADGSLGHVEYLHDCDDDPRLPFLESLLDAMGEVGSVVVYSSYEATQLRCLATDFPEHAASIDALVARFVDLLAIIREHYYHPDFGGSYSIKKVLPALVPDLTYDDLAVREGAAAVAMYRRLFDPELSAEDRAGTREAMLRYCERDTFAMVRVREALLERC